MRIIKFAFILFFALLPFTASAKPVLNQKFVQVMQEGITYYKAGTVDPINYQQALEIFLRAEQLEGAEPIVLYNIGRTYQHLGNCEQALDYFERYQEIAKDDVDYNDPNKYIEPLSKQCGSKVSVNLVCDPKNATVSIDSERSVSCGSVRIKPGNHRFVANADGYLQSSLELSVSDGQNVELKLSPKYSEVPGNAAMRYSGIALTAAGGAAAIAGSFILGFASGKSDAMLYTGVELPCVGALMAAGGITLIALDINRRNDNVSFIPTIMITPDAAHAGFSMTF